MPIEPPARTRPVLVGDLEWIEQQAREVNNLKDIQMELDGHVYDPILKEVVERAS